MSGAVDPLISSRPAPGLTGIRDHGPILDAVMGAMIGEVDALKPGNVHRFAGGHGMQYEQFLTSAEVSAPALCEAGAGVGRRVLEAVRATRLAVGTNTNLGLLLLFAPLVRAVEQCGRPKELRRRLGEVLAGLEKNDARQVFAAIRLASPGGLGHASEYDVHSHPDCTLRQAMAAAAGRDMIARQYACEFEEVFGMGLAGLREFETRWDDLEWATVGCFLRFLAHFPDSHVLRRYGRNTAERIQARSRSVLKRFENKKNPQSAVQMLLEFDLELKNAGINPGTSADLTAASLLLHLLDA